MAHELTERADGYVEMAFVGQTPWHGLGQQLDQSADIDSWKKAAGMDWTIESAPALYLPKGAPEVLEMKGQRILFRSDTHAPLSAVSTRYKPVQPGEVLEFFRELVEENGFKLHTAGTLFGGRRMWALAETGKFAEVSKGDGIGGFLLLSTSADKSLATTARFTTIRVVCNNTLSIATNRGDNVVSFTHSREFDHELMRDRLGNAVESFGAFMDAAKYMNKQIISSQQASEMLKKLVTPVYGLQNEQYDPEKNRVFVRMMELFNGAAKGHEYCGQTRWGLMNAITEYYDHHSPARTDDARLNNAWFANGQSIKQRAFEMLTA